MLEPKAVGGDCGAIHLYVAGQGRRRRAGGADAVGAVRPGGNGRFRLGAPEAGMAPPFTGNTKPTQLRAPGKINTGITRTKRYCSASDGTLAKMSVLAHRSPHAGQTG